MYAIPNKCLELRLLLHMQYNVFDVKFLVPSKFFMRFFFKHDAFNVGVRPRSQKLIWHKYSIYTHVLILWIKGCQLSRYFKCDVTHQKYFGLGWTALDKVRKHIFYIIDDIIILLWRRFCDILCVVLSFLVLDYSIYLFPTLSWFYFITSK